MRAKIRYSYLIVALSLAVAALAACGGDDDAPGGPRALTPSSSGSGDNGNGDNGDGDNGDGDDGPLSGLDFGAGTAVVVIGDDRYEFALETRSIGSTTYLGICRGVFGAIQVGGVAEDGREITVEMWIPPTNWDTFEDERYDPPSIKVEIPGESGREIYEADQSIERHAGSSQVDDYELDGLRAAGSATFIDTWAATLGGDPQPIQGTFQVACE